MTLAKMHVSVVCPACGSLMKHNFNSTIECCCGPCEWYGIQFKTPVIELELVEAVEEKTINETIDSTASPAPPTPVGCSTEPFPSHGRGAKHREFSADEEPAVSPTA